MAYVPDKMILGLSKLWRIAGYFARRLQNQERTAHSIALFVAKLVETPWGSGSYRRQTYVCHGARCARNQHSVMKVNVMHGTFPKDQNLPNELLTMLRPSVAVR